MERAMTTKFNFDAKFAPFSEHWWPKVIAVNDHEFKIVKIRGDSGFRDHVAELGPGVRAGVPRGVEYRTCADDEAEIPCFEPAGVRNIEDADYAAPDGVPV
jgi:hypothetical protein